MIAPLSFLSPRIQFDRDKLDEMFLEMKEQNKLVEAGVKVEGPAAAYALVWEWGNARQTKKGPKTTLGINPDGERVWLTIQAPHGYIRVGEPLYVKALQKELSKVRFTSTSTGSISQELQNAAIRAAKTMRDIIKEHAPVDSGELRDGIKLVEPGDPLLEESEEFDALELSNEE
jgi:flavin-binding protein dodecin